MRTLIVNTFMSLDGVMQAPGGPDEDPTGGFELGGWGVPYFDEEMMRQVAESAPYELLLGRGTYEIFAAHWPYDNGADRRPAQQHPQARRLDDARPRGVEQLDADRGRRGGLRRAPSRARTVPRSRSTAAPGLIQTLLEHDLIDEYRLWIFPVVVGGGKRFFGEGAIPVALKLVDSKVTKTGVTVNVYERGGAVASGSFEFEQPTEAELERRRRLQ